ncbi:MAG: type II secretion system protein [Candidatus Omnitrophica bacterium]|nr:type II secretion system protein [Candidatus Omnitrophota bacterium]
MGNYHRKGVSLLEVVVSIIILSVAVAGIISVFVSSTRHFRHQQERIDSAEAAKAYFSQLAMDVRQDTWGNPNCLSLNQDGDDGVNPAGCPPDTTDYDFRSRIDGVAGTSLRRVNLMVEWSEPN